MILGIGEPSRLDALGRNGCTTANSESVWTLQGAANVPVNVSKRLTHYMTVVDRFRHNLRLSPAPAHAQARGVRPYRESNLFLR